MAIAGEVVLRQQILSRRERLQAALAASAGATRLVRLLEEVDSALARMDNGTYGLCLVCGDPVEADRLAADPLIQNCVDHLTPDQRRALEQDLDLASHIQTALLPENSLRTGGWEIYHHYDPAGPVSGDYCDLLRPGSDSGSLFFFAGDVSGKGVAASILMSQLHAIFRSLADARVSVSELVARANRVFANSTLSMHYATLVCGKAGGSGEVEICNAGHCPPFMIHSGQLSRIQATGLPLGLFASGEFSAQKLQAATGDTLFLYSDGLSEARNHADIEYGEERLVGLLEANHALPPRELAEACLRDLESHLAGAPRTDDLTIMVIRRAV